MHRTHAGHGSIWPAEAVEAHASLDAAERASRAREDALREAAALLDLTNGDILLAAGEMPASELLTARAVLAWRRSAILALINKPKGGDVNAAVESRYGDATSPGVTAGASAGEVEELCGRLEELLRDPYYGACSAFNEALVMLRSLSDDKKKLVNLLASDTRVDAILEAVLTPRGDPEDGTRDHLPRALRDYLGKVGATSFKTGWNDGYAEGFGKAEAEAAARIRSLSSRVERAERARREEELREDARLGAALARAESSEALVAELREKVERLRKALEPFAEAATKGEIGGYPPNYFVGATEFENARRACTALEGRDD